MKIINYLNNKEIVSLYEKIHTFEAVSSQWQLSAIPLLNMVLLLEEYDLAESKAERLSNLLIYDNLIKLLKSPKVTSKHRYLIYYYLNKIPNFNRNAKKQSDEVLEIHGYRTMLLFRYINDLNNDFMEFPLLKKEWANTPEKENILKNIFGYYLKKESIDSLHCFKNMKENITNFSIIKLYLQNKEELLFDLLYKFWFDSKSRLAEEYDRFQDCLKPMQILIDKEILVNELAINKVIEKKKEKI